MGARKSKAKSKANRKSTKTKEKPKSTGSQRDRIEPESSARVARNKIKPRKDVTEAMKKIYNRGWEYDEEKAKQLRLDKEGYYIGEQVTVIIDPEDAFELFMHHNYKGNRNFNQAHATRLAEAMGIVTNIDIAVGPSARPDIVNGQHSLWAIYMKNLPLQTAVKIYQCKDDNTIASLYAIFDDNQKRTYAQAIHAATEAGSIQTDINSVRFARWAQFSYVAENGYKRKGVESLSFKLERAKREDVKEFIEWIDPLVVQHKASKLVSQGIGAAIWSMFISDPPNAQQFTEKYLSGVGLDAADNPILKLRNWILNRPPGEHAGTVCRYYAEMAYTSWRKFCLGENLMNLRRTRALPQPDEWKIYVSPTTVKLEIKGAFIEDNIEIDIAKGKKKTARET